MHDAVRTTKDEQTKPDVHKMYDFTKGGVDVVDLFSSNSSTRMKSERWTMNTFALLLDTERTNAMTIMKEASGDKNMSSFEFTWQLGTNLVVPHMHRRSNTPTSGYKSPYCRKCAKFLVSRRDPIIQGREVAIS